MPKPTRPDFFRLALRPPGCWAKAEVARRVRCLALKNPGAVKPVGKGVSELRIPYGPRYRVYYMQRGSLMIALLWGDDKSGQAKDIALAEKRAKEV